MTASLSNIKIREPSLTLPSQAVFTPYIKFTNVREVPSDQGDLTEEEAIAEAQEIMTNPNAHEWLPMKAARTKPDA
jgi:hypothetical protein